MDGSHLAALCVVLCLVIVCLAPQHAAFVAVALAAAIAGYYFSQKRVPAPEKFTDISTTLPGAPVPTIGHVPHQAKPLPAEYPGAVVFEQEGIDTEGVLVDGTSDRLANGTLDGEVYNASREDWGPGTAGWKGAESNNAALNFDERIANNSLSRNDPTRPTVGTMRRRCEMDRFFREEVAAREQDEWWGNHEY